MCLELAYKVSEEGMSNVRTKLAFGSISTATNYF